ncbi:MAG TPA: alpha-L-fucosidase [Opitutaceae bacterium]
MRGFLAYILAGALASIGPALAGAEASGGHPAYRADWASLDSRPCPEWYLDAKFGIFIHWGVYSVPAWGVKQQYAEWYWYRMADKKPGNPWWEFHKATYGENFPYQDFAPRFTCELFDAAQWADFFVRSGARYVVPTSKHHEGFCLWPSREADRDWGRPWNSMDVGPKRDLMGELSAAARARGLRFGFYYSLYEWFNPLWLSDRKRFVDEHFIPQFKDVVTRYKPALIFADGEWEMSSKDWKSEQLLAWLFNESPSRDEVVVDDRWGSDSRHRHGTYYTTEYAAGMEGAAHPWEENEGLGYSYGYNRAETIDDYKSARMLTLLLVDTVSRGGNLLLDIGPRADGTIPTIMQERLLELGSWLKVNGDAIYGTRFAGRACQWSEGKRPAQKYGDYNVKYDLMAQVGQAPNDGHAVKQVFFTKKADALYAITAGWPGRQLVLKGVSLPHGSSVYLLGYDHPLVAQASGSSVTVTMPEVGPEALPCRYAFALKLPGAKLIPDS